MKKISLLVAYIVIITAFFSCSKKQDQYFSPAAPHPAQAGSKVPGDKSNTGKNFNDQKNDIEGLNENTNSLFGGGDDDKPIIMHRVISEGFGPLQYASVMMINNRDSLQSVTDSAGECTLELPRVGTWELKIGLSRFSSLDTLINVTDSFSLKTTNLIYQ